MFKFGFKFESEDDDEEDEERKVQESHRDRADDASARASDYYAVNDGLNSSRDFLNTRDNWKQYDKIPGHDETIRQRYGSQASQNAAKERAFEGGRKVRDSHSGKQLCRTIEEAQAKYGAGWADHVAEADHVVPVKHLYEKHKGDTWLTDEDIREVVNQSDNFQMLSKKNNTTKGSKTEEQYLGRKDNGLRISKKKRERILSDAKSIENGMDWELTQRKAKNIGKTFHESGAESVTSSIGVTSLLTCIDNISEVVNKRKSFPEAMGDAVIGVGQSAASSYLVGGGVTVAQRTIEASQYEMIRWLGQFNVPAKMVTAMQVCFTPIKQYISGEIPMGECAKRITKGAADLAIVGECALYGQAMIPVPVVGAVVGTLVGMCFTKSLFAAFESIGANRQRIQELQRLEEIYSRMAMQYREYRMELENTLSEYFAGEKKFYAGCLDLLDEGIRSDNDMKVAAAAKSITRHLGGTDNIDTIDDLCALFDD